jgi:hypothetical protein
MWLDLRLGRRDYIIGTYLGNTNLRGQAYSGNRNEEERLDDPVGHVSADRLS